MIRGLGALVVVTLAWVGSAHAEMPSNRGAPEVTGRAAVGWGVVAHNGTWLYLDGTACGPECLFSFAWERCNAFGCRPIAGAIGRVYKVRAVDVGFRFRAIVEATKHDCGALNFASGTQECRWVTRTAVSQETAVVPKPKKKRRR